MAKHLIGCWGAAANAAASISMMFACCTGGAFARDLPDPTRPPDLAAKGVPAIGGSGSSAGIDASEPFRLQSVIVSPGRKVAVINGQIVEPGDKVGDAVVVEITESEVVLRSGKDLQTVKLFPGLEKRPVSDRVGVKSLDRRP